MEHAHTSIVEYNMVHLNTFLYAYMQLMWMRLYRQTSTRENGTLYQLRRLIQLTSVRMNLKEGMNATEDFMHVLLEGHILATSCHIAGLAAEQESITTLSDGIVNSFVQPFFFTSDNQASDNVHKNSCHMLILSLVWYSLKDAMHEGDGPTVLLMWKVMTIAFR